VEALCEIVRAPHPGLVESVKWNSPNWSLGGTDLLTVNVPGRGPVRLMLHPRDDVGAQGRGAHVRRRPGRDAGVALRHPREPGDARARRWSLWSGRG